LENSWSSRAYLYT